MVHSPGQRRGVSIVRLAVLISTTLGALTLATTGRSQAESPRPHPESELRTLSVFGVKLGIAPVDADAAMRRAGFLPLSATPKDVRAETKLGETSGSAYRRAGDGLEAFLTYSKLSGQPVVVSAITLDSFSFKDTGSLQTARQMAEPFLRDLGSPTSAAVSPGSHWVRSVYAPDGRIAEMEPDVRRCVTNWECESVLSGVDCRPIVNEGATVIAAITYSTTYFWLDLTDYARQAQPFVNSRRFRTRDLRGARCVVPTVH